MYHHHRTDLLSFYTQYFKYGIALPYLQLLHPRQGFFAEEIWLNAFRQNRTLANLVMVGNLALRCILLGPVLGRDLWIRLFLKWVQEMSFVTGNMLGHIRKAAKGK